MKKRLEKLQERLGPDAATQAEQVIATAKRSICRRWQWTEPRAHGWLTRQAMNRRLRLEQVAKLVLEGIIAPEGQAHETAGTGTDDDRQLAQPARR